LISLLSLLKSMLKMANQRCRWQSKIWNEEEIRHESGNFLVQAPFINFVRKWSSHYSSHFNRSLASDARSLTADDVSLHTAASRIFCAGPRPLGSVPALDVIVITFQTAPDDVTHPRESLLLLLNNYETGLQPVYWNTHYSMSGVSGLWSAPIRGMLAANTVQSLLSNPVVPNLFLAMPHLSISKILMPPLW
jgi:hypothetical protein